MNGGFLGYYKLMGAVSGDRLFDAYPTTAPNFWLGNKLKNSFTGDIVLCEKMSDNSTLAFEFEADGSFPSAAIVTFGDGGAVRCRRLYEATGAGTYLDFGTGTQSPLIVDASGNLIVYNSLPALRFDGSQHGELASSSTSYNFIHNGLSVGTTLTRCLVDTGATSTDIVNNAPGSSSNGFRIRYQTTDRILTGTYRIASYSALVFPSSSFPVNTDTDIFQKWDVGNATNNQKLKVKINTTEYATNTQSNAPNTGNATYNLTVGASADFKNNEFNGLFVGFLVWDEDLYANETDIKSYL